MAYDTATAPPVDVTASPIPPYVSPFTQSLAELRKRQAMLDAQAPPTMDPQALAREYQQNRGNEALGMLAALSPDKPLQNVGGVILQKALGANQLKPTDHGVYDPRTGQFSYFPQYRQQRQQEALDREEARLTQAEALDYSRQQEARMRQDERVGMQSTQLAQQKQQAEANRQMREELAKQHQQQGAQNQQQMTMARNAGIELRMSQQFQHQIREEDATLAATQKLEQLAPSMVGRNLNSIEQQTVAVLLQKFLDPASVVREGEYGRAALAMGFVDRAQMYYDSIMKGALLSPRMVNDIISMSKMYTKSASGKIQKIGDQYAQIAKRRGLDPENVITSPYYTWPGTPGSAPAADIKVIPKSGPAPAPQTDRRQGNRYQVDY